MWRYLLPPPIGTHRASHVRCAPRHCSSLMRMLYGVSTPKQGSPCASIILPPPCGCRLLRCCKVSKRTCTLHENQQTAPPSNHLPSIALPLPNHTVLPLSPCQRRIFQRLTCHPILNPHAHLFLPGIAKARSSHQIEWRQFLRQNLLPLWLGARGAERR